MPTVPGVTQVSGKYTNEDAGVEIVFPDGWEGFEINSADVLLVMTTQGGSISGNTTTEGIGLIVGDSANLEGLSNSFKYTNDSVSDCSSQTVTDIQISGKSGKEISAECVAEGGPVKMKIAFVQTATMWVGVMLMAPPADFESDAAKFDSTVASLKVVGAMDVKASGGQVFNVGLELNAIKEPITINGKSILLDLKTNSTISNFAVDENNNKLSFKAEGKTGTHGTTEVAIGKVLKGPYAVSIDGQYTSNFKVIGNEASADAMISISYTHSSHDITITGTNVVPEFPLAMIGAVAGIIGVVAVLGRTKIFKI
jgi:hypothetical protein